MSEHLMHTYARLPVTFSRGQGAWLWDTDERRYLDALSGIAVCGLGHAHPAVTEALCDQAGRLLHTSNLYNVGLQSTLADRLCAVSGQERVFFCNSGAEANEAAIKISRRYGHQKGLDRPSVIVMDNSFHGRTLATLSATGNPKVQEGFEPLVDGFVRVPFDDLQAIERAAEDNPQICAVLVEPVQGEGGVRVPAPDYLAGIRQLCDARGWLMMCDEIQSGTGRTGRWFACQHDAVLPDVVTVAKALGNGVPIGACAARGPAGAILGPGSHGTTFGGNPLAARAALAVLDAIERDGLLERCETLGEQMVAAFRRRLGDLAGVNAVRGRGLMIGIELDRPCANLVKDALDAGLLINVTAGNVVRLLPPYIIDDEQAGLIVDGVCDLIQAFLAGNDVA